MAQAGCHRILQLPFGANERLGARHVPLLRHRTMAAHAAAAQSKGRYDLGADHAPCRRLAPQTAHSASLAASTLRMRPQSAHLMSMDYQQMSRTAQPLFDLDQSCEVKEIGARARAHGRLNAADNFYVTDFGRIEDIRRSVFVGRSAEP